MLYPMEIRLAATLVMRAWFVTKDKFITTKILYTFEESLRNTESAELTAEASKVARHQTFDSFEVDVEG